MTKKPLDILKQYWGYDSFRPMQAEIIQSVLDGKDSLALLPTGGGKSICFQVPALCMDGITVVISPLIALMKDQVDNLQKRGVKAAAIYSGMHYKDIDRVLDNCVYGDIKLLYLSPERLVTDMALERIKRMPLNFIAVDEAHCISQWGYDFRPAYLRIAELREHLPKVHFIALTATATEEVVADIQEKLEFQNGQVFQKSFTRSNLAYVVLKEENKEAKLLDILNKVNVLPKVKDSGVVYVRSRRKTKEIALFLQKKSIRADFYHAGLSSDLRTKKQLAWINGQIQVMVSTNAFGMGIDKSNVRSVVHMDLPDSLEAYFQEAGRAGRDEKKAYAVLLYNEADKDSLEYSYQKSYPAIKDIKRVYQALGSYFQLAVGSGQGESFDFEITTFTKNYGLDILMTYNALKIIEQSGWIQLSDSIFIPSSVKIIVNKEKLYDYQIRNPKLELILKTILRTTQGAFNDYVRINEKRLANLLKINRMDLIRALHKIQQDGIVAYRPMKDTPQIIYLQEQVDVQNFTIDTEAYNFRKKRHEFRIQQAIAYAEKGQCRSQFLLQYFGEKSKECGVCDVCLNRKSETLTDAEFERYKEKIQQLLRREKLSIAEIADSFAPKRKPKVFKTIEYLLDENFIELEGEKLIWRA